MKFAYILHGNFKFISRAHRQIDALLKDGHDVDVYDGYFSKKPNHYTNSYKIEYVKIKEGRIGLINFISLLFFNLRVALKVVSGSYDAVICRELSTLLSGVIVKYSKTSVKLTYDSNELSVETHKGFRKSIWKIIEHYCVRYCDLIVHAEAQRMKYFGDFHRNRLHSTTQIVIPNYVAYNPSDITTVPSIRALYFGAIGTERGIGQMIEAFSYIKDIQLHIMGFGSEKYIQFLKDFISVRQISNIVFVPPIDDSQIYEEFKKYKIGIAFYPNTSLNNWFCAPNKVYQYIQSNMAVLTTNNPGLVSLIDTYKCGAYIDKIDVKSIHGAVIDIVENKLWCNITDDMKLRYSWDNLESEFVKSVKQIIK